MKKAKRYLSAAGLPASLRYAQGALRHRPFSVGAGRLKSKEDQENES